MCLGYITLVNEMQNDSYIIWDIRRNKNYFITFTVSNPICLCLFYKFFIAFLDYFKAEVIYSAS